MEQIFATLAAGRHRAQRPLPGLGLHGRERAQPVRACARHPRRRVRRARRHEPHRPAGRRARAPQFTVTRDDRLRPAARRLPERRGRQIARKVDGTFTVPCYLNAAGCPPRLALHLPARLDDAAAHPRQHDGGQLHLPDPARRPSTAPQVARRGRRSTGTACSAARARSPPGTSRRWPTSTTSSSAPPTGRACRRQDMPEHRVDPRRPLELLVAARPRAAGLRELHVPRPAADPPARASAATRRSSSRRAAPPQSVIDTTRLFYDGNSQGGIMGGVADRARARLQPRRARRAGHELLDPAAPQRRLRPVRGQVLYANYPNELERPLIFSLMQMLWDRGEANGYAHHMTRRPAPEHAGRTPCCCTRRSATTRSPTSRPRSRRARSARTSASRRSTPGGTATSTRTSASRQSRPIRSTARRSSSGTADRRPRRRTKRRRARRRPAQPPAQHGRPRALQKSEFLQPGRQGRRRLRPAPCYANGYTGNGQ